MTGRIKKKAMVAAIALQGAAIAWAQVNEPINADRPGIADGSKVIGHGRLQIEAGFQKEFRRAAGTSNHRAMAPLLLRAGMGQNWEFRLETNSYVFQTSRDASGSLVREEGRAPVALGAKYQITDVKDGTTPSLGMIARLVPQSGSGSFRSQRTSGDLRLAADWDFAQKWSLNPNIGVGLVEDDEGRTFSARTFAATLSYNPTASLSLFVDAGMQSPEKRGGRASVILDAGLGYLLTPNVQLDFSVGKGVRGNTSPRAFVSAGISTRF
ncbi:MAG: transporter [Polaromonas sp.]|nr:transporter [Polaromonas sp.]